MPVFPAPSHSRRWLTLGLVGCGVAVGPLDTAVNIAFPAITNAFHITVPTIQWVVICYVLTYASLLLGCGRLADILGHKRVFLWGLWWSTVSFLLCGLAPSFGWLLVFRGCQGIGIALVLSCGPALATLSFDETERGRILGLYAMLVATASTLGPLLGGMLVQRWGWPAVFFFRAPIALAAALLVTWLVRQPVDVKPGQRFDAIGAATLTLSLIGLLLAFNRGNDLGWFSGTTLGLGAVACACLGWFIWQERHCAEPVIDLTLFRYPAFAIANLAHTLLHLASFTVLLLVPYYLLNYHQASVQSGGIVLAAAPLGTMIASPLGGRLLARYTGYRLSMMGLACSACGLAGMSQWQVGTPTGLLMGVLLVQGVGLGLFQVANMDFVMGTIPRVQQGVAGSLTMLTRTIGVVSGASLGALLFGLLQPHYAAVLRATGAAATSVDTQAFLLAFRGTFLSAAAVAVLAGVLMWGSHLATRPQAAA